MTTFETTRGTVFARAVEAIPSIGREGHWGKGGGYRPKVSYVYVVDGVTYTADRWSYAIDGLKRAVAEQCWRICPTRSTSITTPTRMRATCRHTCRGSATRLSLAVWSGAVAALAALLG